MHPSKTPQFHAKWRVAPHSARWTSRLGRIAAGCAALLIPLGALAQPSPPAGEIKGRQWEHTPHTLEAAVAQAAVVLPAAVSADGQVLAGTWQTLGSRPGAEGRRVPVVVFLHGSSGLGLKAIGEWQQWLASLGVASMAPDSFALPERVTYTSPIATEQYERIHALRGSEADAALAAVRRAAWADPEKLILAGTSEGAVAVARYAGAGVAAKMVFSWSCEPNYFVSAPRNAFRTGQPVLNVISTVDPYFSSTNAWLGNAQAQGDCSAALQGLPRARVVRVPGAPHTLLNLPAAREAVAEFLKGL